MDTPVEVAGIPQPCGGSGGTTNTGGIGWDTNTGGLCVQHCGGLVGYQTLWRMVIPPVGGIGCDTTLVRIGGIQHCGGLVWIPTLWRMVDTNPVEDCVITTLDVLGWIPTL